MVLWEVSRNRGKTLLFISITSLQHPHFGGFLPREITQGAKIHPQITYSSSVRNSPQMETT